MRVEFNTFGGSEKEMALEIIPETEFEKTFIKRASKYGEFVIREPMGNVLLMLGIEVKINKPQKTETSYYSCCDTAYRQGKKCPIHNIP